eukprot:m.15118 g.15118  ORF g.15118 m.15118 type:complete len:398 (-) comp7787_c1_seq2:219-1412(-)
MRRTRKPDTTVRGDSSSHETVMRFDDLINESDGRQHQRQDPQDEFSDLQDMGDWAQIDSFEWDETDITLSTDEGLRWLQTLGIISDKYRAKDLSETQRKAVDNLLNKLKEKHQIQGQSGLTVQDIQKDESIKDDVQKVIALLPSEPEAEQGEATPETEEDAAAPSANKTAAATKQKITAENISDVAGRLSLAWGHALEAKKANKQLEREMSELLLMSRARLQAEIISLRRENEALRKNKIEETEALRALAAEKQFTAELQEVLDHRDAEIMQLSHQLTLKNDELAVFRSTRDLSTSWRESRQMSLPPTRRSSVQPATDNLQTASQEAAARKGSLHEALLSRRNRLDELLDRHGVPRDGRGDMWEGAKEAANTARSSTRRQERLEVRDGSPLASKFVI